MKGGAGVVLDIKRARGKRHSSVVFIKADILPSFIHKKLVGLFKIQHMYLTKLVKGNDYIITIHSQCCLWTDYLHVLPDNLDATKA